MIVIGLTGGIGSGKSTVTSMFEALGAKIVKADDLAKKLMTQKPLKDKIINVFGKASYLQDGSLNKAHLIKEAFVKNRVTELNDIVHPAVKKTLISIIEDAMNENIKLLVYEATLLLDYGRPDYIDYIVVVSAKKKSRVARVAKRDNITVDAVIDRMDKQMSQENMIKMADFVIENESNIESLFHETSRILDTILIDYETNTNRKT